MHIKFNCTELCSYLKRERCSAANMVADWVARTKLFAYYRFNFCPAVVVFQNNMGRIELFEMMMSSNTKLAISNSLKDARVCL